MLRIRHMIAGTFLAIGLLACQQATAQQVQLTSPMHNINDSFYENFGIGWGTGLAPNRNWFFNSGAANSTPPPFGGYDPAADARFGFRLGPFNFNMLAGTGSTRSNVMQAPTIVIPNGGSGMLFDGSIRPFVTGVVPVVGAGPLNVGMPMIQSSSVSPLEQRLAQMRQEQALRQQQAAAGGQPAPVGPRPPRRDEPANAPLRAPAKEPDGDAPALVIRAGKVQDSQPASGASYGSAADSSAGHGDVSVADIQRQQAIRAAAAQQEIQARVEKARGFEDRGQVGIAKIYYQQAAARADGELKQQLLDKIRLLGD